MQPCRDAILADSLVKKKQKKGEKKRGTCISKEWLLNVMFSAVYYNNAMMQCMATSAEKINKFEFKEHLNILKSTRKKEKNQPYHLIFTLLMMMTVTRCGHAGFKWQNAPFISHMVAKETVFSQTEFVFITIQGVTNKDIHYSCSDQK